MPTDPIERLSSTGPRVLPERCSAQILPVLFVCSMGCIERSAPSYDPTTLPQTGCRHRVRQLARNEHAPGLPSSLRGFREMSRWRHGSLRWWPVGDNNIGLPVGGSELAPLKLRVKLDKTSIVYREVVAVPPPFHRLACHPEVTVRVTVDLVLDRRHRYTASTEAEVRESEGLGLQVRLPPTFASDVGFTNEQIASGEYNFLLELSGVRRQHEISQGTVLVEPRASSDSVVPRRLASLAFR